MDAAFAQNLRIWREARGLSQTDLARQMAGLGFAYHQQTVAKIESGNRAVPVGEAAALADLVVSDIRTLIRPEPDPDEIVLLDQMIEEMTAECKKLEADVDKAKKIAHSASQAATQANSELDDVLHTFEARRETLRRLSGQRANLSRQLRSIRRQRGTSDGRL